MSKEMNGRLIRYKLFEMSLQFYRGISQFRSGTLHKIKYCYADISQ